MSKVKWNLDPAHSELMFKVKHLMISTVTGHFKIFSLSVETEENSFVNPYAIELIADVESINTNNEQRDVHLKSEDFLDSVKHSHLVFKGSRFEGNEAEGKIYGELTIRGITKKIIVHVDHGGIAVDPYGQTKAGFTVEGKISRKEFGLTWSAVTEAGNIVVGDEVKFSGEIQLIKQA